MRFQGFTAAKAALESVALARDEKVVVFVDYRSAGFHVLESDEVMFAVALFGRVAFGEFHSCYFHLRKFG